MIGHKYNHTHDSWHVKFVTELKFFALNESMSKNRLTTHVSGTALASVGDNLPLMVFATSAID